MINISDILDPRAVALELRSAGRDGVLLELAELFVGSGVATDPSVLHTKFLERERLTSTGMGEGIAIPHCAADGITHPALAFGRSNAGIPFDSPDGLPVTLFFAVVVPAGRQTVHLQILSRLARLLRSESLRAALASASAPSAVVDSFRELERE